jgi:hypothetical protein
VGYWSIGRLMAALGAAQNGAGVGRRGKFEKADAQISSLGVRCRPKADSGWNNF